MDLAFLCSHQVGAWVSRAEVETGAAGLPPQQAVCLRALATLQAISRGSREFMEENGREA